MRKAATGKELAASFDEHMADAEKQIDTLNQVFELMGKKPATKKCDAMEGLLSEADSIISEKGRQSATPV
jgi:ferritin-like metal-binding protein YciE